MKLVQKILSHGLLIAFIVAAFFVYLNRVDLFPQWFAKPAPAPVSHTQVAPGHSATAAANVPAPETGGDTPVVVPVEVDEVEVVATETDAVAPEPAAAEAGRDVIVMESDTVVAVPATENPASIPGDSREQTDPAAVEPKEEQQEPVSENAAPVFRPLTETGAPAAADSATDAAAGSQQTAVGSTPEQVPGSTGEQAVTENQPAPVQQAAAGQETAATADYQAQLDLARTYFWKRDIRAALQAYQALAETWPERAEIWGEMGNLYFTVRRKSDAMNAYARAVKLLTEQGDDAGARALLDVMYRLDARRASQFEMSLKQAGG